MARNTLNLRNLNFLVADANPFSSKIVHSILRNFTAESVFEAHDAKDAEAIMQSSKVDALLVDHRLPGIGGIEYTRMIRQNPAHPCRSIPILIMAGEAKLSLVRAARDAGAHLVVSKPVSPSVLFDRLVWIAYRSRRVIAVNGYFGPDRRFRFENPPQGKARRKSDQDKDQVEASDRDAGKAAA